MHWGHWASVPTRLNSAPTSAPTFHERQSNHKITHKMDPPVIASPFFHLERADGLQVLEFEVDFRVGWVAVEVEPNQRRSDQQRPRQRVEDTLGPCRVRLQGKWRTVRRGCDGCTLTIGYMQGSMEYR